ncbi:MAG: transporter substrate-binding domain-containing protein [Prevotella sp.]|nr:transporter substrate-binding domain-containing protein [Prevotella sp.]
MKNTLLYIICFLWPVAAWGTPGYEVTREFTEEHPLVYEDSWDLWPYAYLNDNGDPVGYNIDLLKLIFKRLGIPYQIKLRPTSLALNDLKAGRADVMCGMDAHFHNDFAQYGKSVIQIFTHSVLHRKSEPVTVKTVEDLAHQKVLVHDGSFSHHLMIRHGWGNNAVPYNDMQQAVHLLHNEPGHQIVWNTLSLKFLIRKFHYEELELTPVNIQHGEYKFMSNNPRLLHQMDSVYSILNAEGSLQPIQNKWFYPEKKDTGIPSWIWMVIAALLLFTLVSLLSYAGYRRKERRMTKTLRSSNRRLALILKTSHVRIWVYHVAAMTITEFDENGRQKGELLTPNYFFYSLLKDDFDRIQQTLADISMKNVDELTLDVQAKEGTQGALRSLTIALSVLRRDKNGKPKDIIGTTSDVTEEKLRQRQTKDAMLRYKTVFNNSMVDIVAYNGDGVIIDMNEKARRAFPNGLDSILEAKISLSDVLGSDLEDIEQMEYTYVTQLLRWPGDERALSRLLKREKMNYELQMLPLRDAAGRLQSVFGTGRNVTELADSYRSLRENIAQLQQANENLSKYIRNIDYVMKNGGVRVVIYSLDTHTMTIFSEVGKPQLTLTSTRALTLVSDESKRVALQGFRNMDSRTRSTVEASVKTVLRHRDAERSFPLCFYLSLVPTYDASGQVNGYFGMCRDQSELKATEERLAVEAERAKEVETVKNAFLRNMSYQIRTPLNSVVGFAELFEMEHEQADEPLFVKEINDNASLLLELINDILFLSRLDAQMIDIKKETVNFSELFESRCQTAFFHHQNPDVKFVVDSSYERLMVDVDMQNIGIIIDQILANAAEHTETGQVRASYDYTGEDLIMTFQDTGCGMSAEQQEHIFERFATTGSRGTGLGLNICLELARQMGGKVKVHSEQGKGTIVWVTIPCTCSELVRK